MKIGHWEGAVAASSKLGVLEGSRRAPVAGDSPTEGVMLWLPPQSAGVVRGKAAPWLCPTLI